MPLLDRSAYRSPLLLRNPHVHTAWASLARPIDDPGYERERLELPDGDFLDLDRLNRGNRRVAILSHGLEGHSHRPYMRGMARALDRAGWDVIAWNYRGCSGEPNRLLRSYHSGATEDLEAVVAHVAPAYAEVALVGFSLGGNLTLKYLGERALEAAVRISAAVVFSVPCDLKASSLNLERPANRFYLRRFMRTLRRKIQVKDALHPGILDLNGLEAVNTFREFDDRYTAPIHGFRDAEDYWARASSGPLVPEIRVPTLIVSSLDDPFLTPACFPVREASTSRHVTLETPAHGGHVGFVRFGGDGLYGSERRAVEFLASFVA